MPDRFLTSSWYDGSMSALLAPAEQRFLLEDVGWQLYDSLLREVGDRHIFITFDRGRLELMSPSWRHDRRARRLGLLVTYLADALDIPIEGGGSTTFRREDLRRGLEPDQCFYVENVQKVRAKDEIDLEVDPPPDLAIEVEISRRLIDRVSVYASIGVPELWRDDGEEVRIYRLGEDGRYHECDRGPSFPDVPRADINRLMQASETTDEVTWSRTVRAWANQDLRRG